MELKNAELAMAEDLSEDLRTEFGIDIDQGMIILETKNPDLRQEIKTIPNGSIRAYLLSLGEFKEFTMNDQPDEVFQTSEEKQGVE